MRLKEEIGVNEYQANMCFANSKFPLVDEMDHVEELLCLKFDEFLEFIVRLADMSTFKKKESVKKTEDE